MDRGFWGWGWSLIANALVATSVCWTTTGCDSQQSQSGKSVAMRTEEGVAIDMPAPASETDSVTQQSDQQGATAEPGMLRADVAAAELPPPRSNSPIDQIPEGKLYRQALDAVDRGKPEFALKVKAELSAHPVYGVLGTAIDVLLLATEGRFEEAMKVAEKVSTVQVMQADSYMLAADIFRLQGRYQQAIDCLQSSLQLNAGNPRAQRWLGIIFYDIGAMQQATVHLRQAASIDTLDVGSLRLSSKIFFEYQNFFEAAKDCRLGLDREPTPEIAEELRLRLADSLRELREFEESMEILKQCQPTAEVFVAKARVYESQGETAKAVEACQQGLELEPNQRMGNLILGRLLMSERRFEEAISALELAASADAADHESRFLLGRCLLNTDKRAEGEQMIAKATKLKERFLEITDLHRQAIDQPRSAEIRFQIGQLLEANGRSELARMWYRAALGLDSEHKQAAEAYSNLPAKK